LSPNFETIRNQLLPFTELQVFSCPKKQQLHSDTVTIEAMMKRIQKDIGGVDQVQRLLGDHEEVP